MVDYIRTEINLRDQKQRIPKTADLPDRIRYPILEKKFFNCPHCKKEKFHGEYFNVLEIDGKIVDRSKSNIIFHGRDELKSHDIDMCEKITTEWSRINEIRIAIEYEIPDLELCSNCNHFKAVDYCLCRGNKENKGMCHLGDYDYHYACRFLDRDLPVESEGHCKNWSD